jgi:PAS domain S-box-containing protein
MITSATETKSKSSDYLDEKSLSFHREIIDDAFDAIYIHTLDGKLIEVNAEACRRLGYAREELINKEREELIALTLIGSMPEYIELITRDGELTFESVSLIESGELIPVEVRAKKIVFKGEDAILTFSRDLTAQKEREREIHDRLEVLQRHAVNISRLQSIVNVAEYSFDIIEELLGSVKGGIATVEDGCIKFVFLHGFGPESVPALPLDGRGISVRAVTTGKIQIVSDTSKEPDYIEDAGGIKLSSEIDIPIKIDGKVVAVINIQVEGSEKFTEDNIKTLEILAEHISSAISRIDLIKNLKKAEEKTD